MVALFRDGNGHSWVLPHLFTYFLAEAETNTESTETNTIRKRIRNWGGWVTRHRHGCGPVSLNPRLHGWACSIREKAEGITGLGSRIGWVGPVSPRLARVCCTWPNTAMIASLKQKLLQFPETEILFPCLFHQKTPFRLHWCFSICSGKFCFLFFPSTVGKFLLHFHP